MTRSRSVQFGDNSISKHNVWHFWAGDNSYSIQKMLTGLFTSFFESDETPSNESGITPFDKKLNHLYYHASSNSDDIEAQQDLVDELNLRMSIDETFKQFEYRLNIEDADYDTTNYDCLRALVNEYKESCGLYEEYVMSKTSYLVKACNAGFPVDIMRDALRDSCSTH